MFLVALAVAGAVIVTGYEALSEQGPNRWLVLIRRYSIWPFVLCPAGLLVAVGLAVAAWQTVTWLVLAAWWAACVGLWKQWDRRTPVRAVRRMVLRARWPSVARSAGLVTDRDRRARTWPGGARVNRRDDSIEWLAAISHGRALPRGLGVTYTLTPARGQDLLAVSNAVEALAAGLRVAAVEVDYKASPYKGRLTVIWHNVLGDTINGADLEAFR